MFFKKRPKIKITTTKPEIKRLPYKKNNLLDNSLFSERQKEIINIAINEKLPYTLLLDIEYSERKMEIILDGLRKNIILNQYIDPKMYNEDQLYEILDGIINKLDVEKIANTHYSAEKMRKLKLGLIDNVDLTNYLHYPEDILLEIKLFLMESLSIDDYLYGDYSAAQLKEIRLGLLSGIDVSIYTLNEYSPMHMKYIRQKLENDEDVSDIADPSLQLSTMLF